MRFAAFMNHRIIKPLGVSSSTYAINEALQTGRFTDTWTSFARLIPPWIQEEYVDRVAGTAGVISSAKIWHVILSGIPNILTDVFSRCFGSE
jgi:hypothetical protein